MDAFLHYILEKTENQSFYPIKNEELCEKILVNKEEEILQLLSSKQAVKTGRKVSIGKIS